MSVNCAVSLVWAFSFKDATIVTVNIEGNQTVGVLSHLILRLNITTSGER